MWYTVNHKADENLVSRGIRREIVERDEIFRGYPIEANGLTITSGRDWLEGRC